MGGAGAALLFWQMTERAPRRPPWRILLGRGMVVVGGLVLTLPPLLIYNQLMEGHWLGRRYLLTVATALDRVAVPNGGWAAHLLPAVLVGGPQHQGIALQPFLAWAVIGAWGVMLAAPWLLRRGWEGAVYAAGLGLIVLSGLALLDPGTYTSVHGLVLIAPVLGLGTWALASSQPIGRLWGWFAVMGLLGYLLFSLVAGWPGQGGLQWGPRYALPLYPLWIVAGVVGLADWLGSDAGRTASARIVLGLVVILALMGVGFQVRGVETRSATQDQLMAWESQLADLSPESLLITDLNYLALSVPDIYRTRTLLLEAAPLSGEALMAWRGQAGPMGYAEVCAIRRAATPTGLQLICHPGEAGP